MTLSLSDYMSDAGVAKWIAELGVTPARVPRDGVRTALAFFSSAMPRLPVNNAIGFLAAMDLSKPVIPVTLQANTRLIGFRVGNESPFKLFFARRGASMHTSGINAWARGAVHFVVRAPVRALESATAGTKDSWTAMETGGAKVGIAPRAHKLSHAQHSFGIMVLGGGRQLIIPESYSSLLVEER